MILCQCDRCKYADGVDVFGHDMFICQLDGNQLIPFDMDGGVNCPCFRVNPYLIEFFYKPLRGKWHAAEFTPENVRKHYTQGHGVIVRYQTVEFYCLPERWNHAIKHRIVGRDRMLNGRKWARSPDGHIITWGC